MSEWIAYIADTDGFVYPDPQEVLRVIEEGLQALEDFEAKHESAVGSIGVATGNSAPRPQFPGADALNIRLPGFRRGTEFVEFDISDGDWTQASFYWRVVQAIANGFNEQETSQEISEVPC